MLGSHKTATGLTTYKFIQCTLEMPFEREYTLRSWQQEIMSVIDDSDKL